MSKLFFIIGMRRSGTSILRELIRKHAEVSDIEFEPHHLWNAIDIDHFKRYKNTEYGKFHERIVKEFGQKGSGKLWHGAKFALNPGVKAMEWVWLPRVFPGARIIFIIRNGLSTYGSYYNEDKNAVRGVVPRELYIPFWRQLVTGFLDYYHDHTATSTIIYYDSLLTDTDKAMKPAWKLLGLTDLTGLERHIKKPRH